MTEFMKKITKQDIRNTLAMVIVIMCFVFLFKLLSRAIPAENQNAVNVLGGIIIGQLSMVISYYFGMSKTEADAKKNELSDQ